MKKLFLLALTCICCLALALPAMAEVKVGGMITLDWNYIDRDEARAANVAGTAPAGVAPLQLNYDNGYEDMRMEFPMPLNFLQVSYVSKDKVVSGLLRWRLGSAGANGTTGAINLYYAWMNYKFSDQFSMRFGRQDTILAPMSPSQLSGFDSWGHIVGIGYGNQNHTSLKDGITAEIKMSPMIALQMGIFDNSTTTTEAPALFGVNASPVGAVPPVVREENVLPRFDIALPITWNFLKIVPSFSYLTQEYDQVVAGSQNDIDIWAGALSAYAAFGPFSITAEVCFGENLGSGNYSGGSLLASTQTFYLDTAGNFQIADTDDIAWFVDLAFKFGPATLHGIYGQINSESEGNPLIGTPGDAAEWDITRQMYGLACPITIGGGFSIRPELFFYDFDDSAILAGAPNRDLGEETIFAVLFMLNF
jgi:hypothetical protein